MNRKRIEFQPIGTIRTPWRRRGEAPRQTGLAGGAEGTVEIHPDLAEGLEGLEGLERIWLIWQSDRCSRRPLKVKPPFDTSPKGVFATRSPARPNCIALSCVRLLEADAAAGRLKVADVDMLDGSPLVDIKPTSLS